MASAGRHFQNLSVFAYQKIHPSRGLVLVFVHSVAASHFPAPVAQQRKLHADLVGKGFVRKGAVHAHTQDLGVGSFQLFQILLEVFHLLGSTTSERENVERQDYVLLSPILAE